MGRAPCCDKANVKKGPWSPEEDAKLKSYIDQNGTGGNWIALPQKIGLKRCGKSCRLRWLNYLRPNIKHGGFSEEEDNIICSLYMSIGSRWSIIAAQLPGRTDNDIKNYWNTRLKKKLLGKQRKEQAARRSSWAKQEMARKGIENSMVANDNNGNQTAYWPELPVLQAPIPYSDHESRFNDITSIRKLLIKLGGRFSDDDQFIHNGLNFHHQLPMDVSSNIQPPFEHSMISALSSVPMDVLNTPSSELENTQYNMDGVGLHILPGQSSFPAVFEEMILNNPQKLAEMELLYEGVVDNRAGIGCGESTDWGGTSSMVYPPFASNYEGDHHLQQQMLQEYAFGKLSYPGEQ